MCGSVRVGGKNPKRVWWNEIKATVRKKGEDEVRKFWKEYFEDLYNIDTQEQVQSTCGFDGIQRGNYFGGEPIGRADVEVRVGKLKNGKVAVKDDITGEMIKGRGDRVVDWIWRLCNMAF